MKKVICFLFLFKTLILGTRKNRLNEIEVVLTSTHNLCFISTIRKMYISVNPGSLYKRGVQVVINYTG